MNNFNFILYGTKHFFRQQTTAEVAWPGWRDDAGIYMYDLEVFKLKKGNASLSHNQNILESSNYTGLETSATASFSHGTGRI